MSSEWSVTDTQTYRWRRDLQRLIELVQLVVEDADRAATAEQTARLRAKRG